jgi:hypothetical protein
MDDNELRRDHKLIILEQAALYCKKNNVDKVRYSELRKLSDVRLNYLTGGFQTNFGGSFDKYITDYESKDDPENRFLIRIREGPKKTFMRLDIQKIENLFNMRIFTHSLSNMTIGTITFHKKVFDNFPISEMLKVRVIRKDHKNNDENDFVVAASDKLRDLIWENLLSIHLIHPQNTTLNLGLNDDDIRYILNLGRGLAVKNFDPSFKIILEYKGIQNHFSFPFYERLLDDFRLWSEKYHNHRINEKDLLNLKDGVYNRISNTTRSKFKKFLLYISNANRENDNPLFYVADLIKRKLSNIDSL